MKLSKQSCKDSILTNKGCKLVNYNNLYKTKYIVAKLVRVNMTDECSISFYKFKMEVWKMNKCCHSIIVKNNLQAYNDKKQNKILLKNKYDIMYIIFGIPSLH